MTMTRPANHPALGLTARTQPRQLRCTATTCDTRQPPTLNETTMNRDELLKLIEAGDLYGLVLIVGKQWLQKYHGEAEYATLLVQHREGVADTVITIQAEPRPSFSHSMQPS